MMMVKNLKSRVVPLVIYKTPSHARVQISEDNEKKLNQSNSKISLSGKHSDDGK
jgi:hypothetical protein